MQPTIKQGLLVDSNSSIKDDQLEKIIHRNVAITDHYHIDKDYFAWGKFAYVRRIQHKQSGKVFAAKMVKKRRLRNGNVTDEIMHEVRVLLTAINCDRIVKLYEVYESVTDFYLILELAEGGELQKILDDDECLEENVCRYLMRQIVEGVQFLHAHQIAHLDIKPQNILLTASLPEGQVKLCDFGISRLITKGSEVREIMGTVDYMPPEILQYEPISLASDMWSIGVLAYVLLSGHTPFSAEDKFATYSNITSSELDFPDKLFDSVSDTAKDFIQKLLIKDPRKRMTCDQCLEHEWLSISSKGNPVPLLTSMNESKLANDLNDNNGHLDNDGDVDVVKTESTTNITCSQTVDDVSSSHILKELNLEPNSDVTNDYDNRSSSSLSSALSDAITTSSSSSASDEEDIEMKSISSSPDIIVFSAENSKNIDNNSSCTRNNCDNVNDADANCATSSGHLSSVETLPFDVHQRKTVLEEDAANDSDKENQIDAEFKFKLPQTAFSSANTESSQSNCIPVTEIETLSCSKNPNHHHKRLSSDIYSDRRLIAVVSSSSLKKHTSESSMSSTSQSSVFDFGTGVPDSIQFTIDVQPSTQSSPVSANSSSMGIGTSQLPGELADVASVTGKMSNSRGGEHSPPLTPNKKFYLSVDDSSIFSEYSRNVMFESSVLRQQLVTLGQNGVNRVRSVSMERLNTTQTVQSELNVTERTIISHDDCHSTFEHSPSTAEQKSSKINDETNYKTRPILADLTQMSDNGIDCVELPCKHTEDIYTEKNSTVETSKSHEMRNLCETTITITTTTKSSGD